MILNGCFHFWEFRVNRSDKEAFVNDLNEGIKKANALAVMSFSKLSVEQMTQFRLGLAKQSIRVKVVKNTLAARAFEGSPYKEVVQSLEGPTLVAYSAGDPVLTTKAIWEWVEKENFNLKVKAGVALGQILTHEKLKALSKLPSKNELFVGFLCLLKSPPTKFLYALQDAPRRLGYVLAALKIKKEKEEK